MPSSTIVSTKTNQTKVSRSKENSYKYADVSYDFTKYLFNVKCVTGLNIDDKLMNMCVVLEMFSYALKYKCDDIHTTNEKPLNYEKRIKNIISSKIGDKKIRTINNLIRKIVCDSLSYVGFNLIIENIPITRTDIQPLDSNDNENIIDNETIYITLDNLNIGSINCVCKLFHDTYAISYDNNNDARQCFDMINKMKIEDNIISAEYITAYQNSMVKDCYIYNNYYIENNRQIFTKYYDSANSANSANISNKQLSKYSEYSSLCDIRGETWKIIKKLIRIYRLIWFTIYIENLISDKYNAVVSYTKNNFTSTQLYIIGYVALIMSCLIFTPILS